MILASLIAFASAQDAPPAGFDAHGFHLAAFDGDPRDPLGMPRAGAFSQGDFFVGLVYEYASAPLLLVEADADGNVLTTTPALDELSTLDISAGAAVFDRVRVDVALPVYVASTGFGGTPNGLHFGDLRATATLTALRPGASTGGFGVALFPYVDLPTGAEELWLGAQGVGGGVGLGVTYETGALTWTGNVAYEARPTVEAFNVTGADVLPIGLALGWSTPGRVGATLEYQRTIPLAANEFPGTTSPSELLLSARTRSRSGGHLVAGAAVGIGSGTGTAAWRLFVGGGIGHIAAYLPAVDPDADHDGLIGDQDACPAEAETVNGWQDDDGCPEAAAVLRVRTLGPEGPLPYVTVDARTAGGGRTFTSADAPEDIDAWAGQEWTFHGSSGTCWVGDAKATAVEGRTDVSLNMKRVLDATLDVIVQDEGGTQLTDAEVRWETERDPCVPTGVHGPGPQTAGAGRHRLIVTAPGKSTVMIPVDLVSGENPAVTARLSPARVRVELRQIVILEKVYFDTDSATIDPVSFALLDEVATTIIAHPELGRVEIGGHTDSVGTDEYNLDLSQRRVDSVREWLVARGVDAARLTAVGYGEMQPIDTNVTEKGRARNRRVEFRLLDAAQ